MFDKPFTAVMAATMLTLGGCATDVQHADPQVPVAQLRDKVITGNASYRERIALPARATFNVRLLDVSRADAGSAIIAEETRQVEGQQVPLPFSIRVKEQVLKTNMRYAVRATITDPAGKLLWTTDTVHSVDPARFEQDLGTLNMVRVGNRSAASGLIGAQFKVEDINRTGLIDSSNVTVQFSQGGRVSGSAGCNRFTGDYSLDGQSLRIGPLAVTRRACVTALGNQETRFLAILQDVTSWSVNGNGSVLLRAEDGRYLAAIR
ncbi:YbaY family lipoprotein [Sphingobium vermicomposti]|nr:YbaY family lipoprotein [Sphingobium vermicomposti]